MPDLEEFVQHLENLVLAVPPLHSYSGGRFSRISRLFGLKSIFLREAARLQLPRHRLRGALSWD